MRCLECVLMNTFGKPPCPECKCLIGLGSRHERREACPWRSRTRQGFFCEQTLPLLALDPSAFLKYTHYGGVRPVHRLRKRAEISSPSLTPCSSLKQRQVWDSLGEHLTRRRSHWVPRQEVAVGWCPEGG